MKNILIGVLITYIVPNISKHTGMLIDDTNSSLSALSTVSLVLADHGAGLHEWEMTSENVTWIAQVSRVKRTQSAFTRLRILSSSLISTRCFTARSYLQQRSQEFLYLPNGV